MEGLNIEVKGWVAETLINAESLLGVVRNHVGEKMRAGLRDSDPHAGKVHVELSNFVFGDDHLIVGSPKRFASGQPV